MSGRWRFSLQHASTRVARPLAASALLCLFALYLKHVGIAEEERASRAAALARVHIEGARAAEAVLTTHGRRYAELQRRGLIGAPDRLGLVEQVQAVARELNLRSVSYDLRPTTLGEGITTTPMQLRAGVRHEGELLHLLEALRRGPAVLWVRRCTIEPASGFDSGLRRDGDNLEVLCDLQFLTVRTRP